MHTLAVLMAGMSLFGAQPDELSQALSGSWWIVGNNHYGALEIQVADGVVSGTIYEQPIQGSFDRTSGQVTFKRQQDAKDKIGVQEWTGQITRVQDKLPPTYLLKGTFKSISSPEFGKPGEEYPWKGTVVRLPPPAEDIQQLQGNWEVAGITQCLDKKTKLPPSTGLCDRQAALEIRGRKLFWNNKLVALLENETPELEALNDKVGWKGYHRPLLLTLPDGQEAACSYVIRDDGVEIAFPVSTSCHRGSGFISLLKRPKPHE